MGSEIRAGLWGLVAVVVAAILAVEFWHQSRWYQLILIGILVTLVVLIFSDMKRERLLQTRPYLEIDLHSGIGGPNGDFLSGYLTNRGPGEARRISPAFAGLPTQPVIKHLPVGQQENLYIRYDDQPCFLQPLADASSSIKYEDISGNHYVQRGVVDQKLTTGGSIWSYTLRNLSDPARLRV